VALHQQENTHSSVERGMRTMNWMQGLLYIRKPYQQLRGMSDTLLRGQWFHIIVVTTHAPTEDKIDDVKDNFYEELECIFDKFHKYHMKIC
jgi:hypothetical protein